MMDAPVWTGDHVVTLGIDFADGREPGRIIYELYRGNCKECNAFARRMASPSHELRSIEKWWLQIGPTQAWEDFVRQDKPFLRSP